jgi:hypothetical protein
VYDENSRIRIQDPDPLVRSMDPRIRIRIHPKCHGSGTLVLLYAPPDLQYVADVTLNGLGRVLETLSSQGVRLDVTCRSQITTLAHLSLLTKVS